MTQQTSRRTLVGILTVIIAVWLGWIVLRPPHKAPPVFSQMSLSSAQEKAKADHKLLIVDAMASWCGPCKRMDSTTWVDDEVVAWVQSHAVAVQVDVDRDRADAKQLRIEAMPTIIIFKDGVEAGRSMGFMDKDQLLSWVAQF